LERGEIMAKKYKINVLTQNGIKQVIAERILEPLCPNHLLMLHRSIKDGRRWSVTEFGTGLALR